MPYLRYLALLGFFMLTASYSQAKFPFALQSARVTATSAQLPFARTDTTTTYECAPYGFYGPDYFVGDVFIGAGPWYRGYYGRGGYGYYGRGRGYDRGYDNGGYYHRGNGYSERNNGNYGRGDGNYNRGNGDYGRGGGNYGRGDDHSGRGRYRHGGSDGRGSGGGNHGGRGSRGEGGSHGGGHGHQ